MVLGEEVRMEDLDAYTSLVALATALLLVGAALARSLGARRPQPVSVRRRRRSS